LESLLDLLTLALLEDVGPRRARDLLARGPLAETLAHPDEHGDLLPRRSREQLRSGEARRRAQEEERRARGLGVRLLGLGEEDYPERLGQIYDPPPVLWVQGRLEPGEGEKSVALVGARAASVAGTALARAMARELAAAGATIVSGLARGIDAAAHRGALDAPGRTVAVLGSGLDRIYPAEHGSLARAILDRGALVSEFPLGTDPRPGHFPRRNRVIAGWSRAVVVVEAAAKSGALVTARTALEEGRDVLAVPGHPSHPNAEGTNQLIRDGAPLVCDARDVAREVGLVLRSAETASRPEDDVLAALRRDAPMSLEDLQARSGRPLPDLLVRLGELELGERVRRLPGPLFVRS
jgi:DNA processing protein